MMIKKKKFLSILLTIIDNIEISSDSDRGDSDEENSDEENSGEEN